MNSRFYWLILILILGSIALGACAAPPAPTATLAPKPTATATAAPKPIATGPGGFPVGIYKPDHKGFADYMMFTATGSFVVSFGDSDTGRYVVDGDQVVINMDAGPCLNHPGTYQWELHGNTLTFKLINETCTESSRSDEMTGRSWILQP